MTISIHSAVSFGVLILAGLCYVTSQVTDVWMESDGLLSLGVWSFCVFSTDTHSWSCEINFSGFNMASQTFSILALLCYLNAFFLYTLSMACRSLQKCRPIITGISCLVFFIVSLQIMTMIVFSVKVHHHTDDVTELHLGKDEKRLPLRLSWSFTAAIVSTILSTISGVCISIELRNIIVDEFQ
uniref:Uncharacterized protein n=1 Tax=Octopus bimaculoides TaxID=37653 RepID=A0A0L8HP53_OCTBM